MREYLFRGKRKDNNQWTYGSLILDVDVCRIHVYGTGTSREVFPDTVGQFTGMKSKSGFDIYEGDVIRFAEKYFYLVKFEDAKFVGYHTNNDWGKWGDLYKLGEPNFSKYDSVVIGNIHDNPELVKPAAQDGVSINMKDPNLKAEEATEVEQAPAPTAGEALESAAQDQAMEVNSEEGTIEG